MSDFNKNYNYSVSHDESILKFFISHNKLTRWGMHSQTIQQQNLLDKQSFEEKLVDFPDTFEKVENDYARIYKKIRINGLPCYSNKLKWFLEKFSSRLSRYLEAYTHQGAYVEYTDAYYKTALQTNSFDFALSQQFNRILIQKKPPTQVNQLDRNTIIIVRGDLKTQTITAYWNEENQIKQYSRPNDQVVDIIYALDNAEDNQISKDHDSSMVDHIAQQFRCVKGMIALDTERQLDYYDLNENGDVVFIEKITINHYMNEHSIVTKPARDGVPIAVMYTASIISVLQEEQLELQSSNSSNSSKTVKTLNVLHQFLKHEIYILDCTTGNDIFRFFNINDSAIVHERYKQSYAEVNAEIDNQLFPYCLYGTIKTFRNITSDSYIQKNLTSLRCQPIGSWQDKQKITKEDILDVSEGSNIELKLEDFDWNHFFRDLCLSQFQPIFEDEIKDIDSTLSENEKRKEIHKIICYKMNQDITLSKLKELSDQNGNHPVFVINNDEFFLYGYFPNEKKWKLTKITGSIKLKENFKESLFLNFAVVQRIVDLVSQEQQEKFAEWHVNQNYDFPTQKEVQKMTQLFDSYDIDYSMVRSITTLHELTDVTEDLVKFNGLKTAFNQLIGDLENIKKTIGMFGELLKLDKSVLHRNLLDEDGFKQNLIKHPAEVTKVQHDYARVHQKISINGMLCYSSHLDWFLAKFSPKLSDYLKTYTHQKAYLEYTDTYYKTAVETCSRNFSYSQQFNRILMQKKPPTELDKNTIVIVGGDLKTKTLTAYWVEDNEIKKFSRPNNQVLQLIGNLSTASSNEIREGTKLFNQILKQFQCAKGAINLITEKQFAYYDLNDAGDIVFIEKVTITHYETTDKVVSKPVRDGVPIAIMYTVSLIPVPEARQNNSSTISIVSPAKKNVDYYFNYTDSDEEDSEQSSRCDDNYNQLFDEDIDQSQLENDGLEWASENKIDWSLPKIVSMEVQSQAELHPDSNLSEAVEANTFNHFLKHEIYILDPTTGNDIFRFFHASDVIIHKRYEHSHAQVEAEIDAKLFPYKIYGTIKAFCDISSDNHMKSNLSSLQVESVYSWQGKQAITKEDIFVPQSLHKELEFDDFYWNIFFRDLCRSRFQSVSKSEVTSREKSDNPDVPTKEEVQKMVQFFDAYDIDYSMISSINTLHDSASVTKDLLCFNRLKTTFNQLVDDFETIKKTMVAIRQFMKPDMSDAYLCHAITSNEFNSFLESSKQNFIGSQEDSRGINKQVKKFNFYHDNQLQLGRLRIDGQMYFAEKTKFSQFPEAIRRYFLQYGGGDGFPNLTNRFYSELCYDRKNIILHTNNISCDYYTQSDSVVIVERFEIDSYAATGLAFQPQGPAKKPSRTNVPIASVVTVSLVREVKKNLNDDQFIKVDWLTMEGGKVKHNERYISHQVIETYSKVYVLDKTRGEELFDMTSPNIEKRYTNQMSVVKNEIEKLLLPLQFYAAVRNFYSSFQYTDIVRYKTKSEIPVTADDLGLNEIGVLIENVSNSSMSKSDESNSNLIVYWVCNNKLEKKSLPEKSLGNIVDRVRAMKDNNGMDAELIKDITLRYRCYPTNNNPYQFKDLEFREKIIWDAININHADSILCFQEINGWYHLLEKSSGINWDKLCLQIMESRFIEHYNTIKIDNDDFALVDSVSDEMRKKIQFVHDSTIDEELTEHLSKLTQNFSKPLSSSNLTASYSRFKGHSRDSSIPLDDQEEKAVIHTGLSSTEKAKLIMAWNRAYSDYESSRKMICDIWNLMILPVAELAKRESYKSTITQDITNLGDSVNSVFAVVDNDFQGLKQAIFHFNDETKKIITYIDEKSVSFSDLDVIVELYNKIICLMQSFFQIWELINNNSSSHTNIVGCIEVAKAQFLSIEEFITNQVSTKFRSETKVKGWTASSVVNGMLGVAGAGIAAVSFFVPGAIVAAVPAAAVIGEGILGGVGTFMALTGGAASVGSVVKTVNEAKGHLANAAQDVLKEAKAYVDQLERRVNAQNKPKPSS